MNEVSKKHVEALALQAAIAAATKSAESGKDISTTDFEVIRNAALEAIAGVVHDVMFGGLNTKEAPAKPQRSRKLRKEAGGSGKGGAIASEVLEAYLKTADRATLQQVADQFSVSKGVAQRAIEALGEKVKSEPGTNPPGKRGKAPTVYFLTE